MQEFNYNLNKTLMRVPDFRAVLFTFGIALVPLYLWESGGMQVSHFLFLGLVVAILFKRSVLIKDPIEAMLVLFTMYCWCRELIAMMMNAPIDTLLPAAHITYSLLIFLGFRRYLDTYIKLRYLEVGLFLSVVIGMIGLVVLGFHVVASEDSVRAVGTFNNPNQLGYFSVLVASLALLLNRTGNLSGFRFWILIFFALFFSMVSLSKAAMVAIAFIPAMMLLGQGTRAFFTFIALRFKATTVLASVTATTAIVIFLIMNADRIAAFEISDLLAFQRLRNAMNEQDSDLYVRGYGLIFESSMLSQVFGLSSYGASSLRDGGEIHSTFMAPLTSYGLLGGTLFLLFFGFWLRLVFRTYGLVNLIIVATPSFLYGITHNGGRFSMFWLFLALAVSPVLTNRTHSRFRHDRDFNLRTVVEMAGSRWRSAGPIRR